MLPPLFLCAIDFHLCCLFLSLSSLGHLVSGFDNFLDCQPGIKLTVPRLFVIADFRFIFEYNNLIPFTFTKASGDYFGALNSGVAYYYVVIIDDKQDSVQLNGLIWCHVEALDIYRSPRCHLVLFTAVLNNSVNF